MSDSPHDANGAEMTGIIRFRVTGPPADFEQAFGKAVDFLRTQDGFVRTTLLRLVREPESELGSYTALAYWRSFEYFQRAVSTANFAKLISEVHNLSTGEPSFYRTRIDRCLEQVA